MESLKDIILRANQRSKSPENFNQASYYKQQPVIVTSVDKSPHRNDKGLHGGLNTVLNDRPSHCGTPSSVCHSASGGVTRTAIQNPTNQVGKQSIKTNNAYNVSMR